MARGDVALWRIAKHTAAFAADDLSGGGAKATGGRWNRKGKAMVYTATTIALATLETLAHTGDTISIRNAFLVKITVPAAVWKLRERVELAGLDATWLASPAGPATLNVGDAWLAACASPLLLVPSVIVPEECNVLINPVHPAAARIRASVVRQYVYDPRL
jgi:RES domain-containing protein